MNVKCSHIERAVNFWQIKDGHKFFNAYTTERWESMSPLFKCGWSLWLIWSTENGRSDTYGSLQAQTLRDWQLLFLSSGEASSPVNSTLWPPGTRKPTLAMERGHAKGEMSKWTPTAPAIPTQALATWVKKLLDNFWLQPYEGCQTRGLIAPMSPSIPESWEY